MLTVVSMKPERKCHCGHKRGDAAIQEEPEWSTLGWIMLSMVGMTLRPHHISFRCMYCRAEVGQSRDPQLLQRRTQPKAAA